MVEESPHIELTVAEEQKAEGNQDKQDASPDSSKVPGKDGNESSKGKEDAEMLYRFASTKDRCLIALAIVGAIAMGSMWPVVAEIFGQVLGKFGETDSVPVYDGVGNIIGYENEKIGGIVSDLALYMFFIAMGAILASWLGVGLLSYVAENLTFEVRKRYMEAILSQDMTWFDEHKLGELANGLSADTVAFQQGSGDKVATFVINMSMGFCGILFGLIRGWQLALVIIGITPFISFAGFMLSKSVASMNSSSQGSYAKAGSLANAALSGIRTVTSFGTQKEELDKYMEQLEHAREAGIKKSKYTGGALGGTQMVFLFSYAISFWFGVWLIGNDVHNSYSGKNWDGAAVVTVFLMMMNGSMGLGQASPLLPQIATGRAAAARLYRVIDRKPKIEATKGRVLDNLVGNIQLRDIHFSYPTRPELPILRGLTIDIPAGQQIALVGESGAGKSSILGLLERFYDPISGSVVVDGVDLKDLQLRWWRSQVGIVSQMPSLFTGSVADNIRFGKPDATQAEIEEAAKQANAHEFIQSLPQGYDTEVGAGGGSLSGGQRQRIAIARALVKNPKLLILDEATSALDNESEKLVQVALDRLMKGRTVVVVAHRLSTVINSDRIVVLRRGEVVEEGTHQELLARRSEDGSAGVYASLVHASDAGARLHEAEGSASSVVAKDGEPGAAPADELKKEDGAEPPQKQQQQGAIGESPEDQPSTPSTKEGKAKELTEEVAKVPNARIFQIAHERRMWGVLAIISGCACGLAMPFWSVAFGQINEVLFEEDYQEQKRRAWLWCGMFVVVGVWIGLSELLVAWSLGVVGEHITLRLRAGAYESLLRQPVAYFDDVRHSSHIMTNRLETEATLVNNGGPPRMANIMRAMSSLLCGLAVAFVYSWQISLLVIATVPFMVGSARMQMVFIGGFADEGKKAFERAGHVSSQAIENIRTVTAFNGEQQTSERFQESLREPLRLGRKKAHVSGLGLGLSQGCFVCVQALCFFVGGYLVDQGDLSLSQMLTAMFALMTGAMGVGQVASSMGDMAEAESAKDQLFHLVDLKSPIDPMSPRGSKPALQRTDIEFDQVRFAYPSAPDREILKGVSFTVPSGSTFALVGQSGCGKSTLMSLLMRWYDWSSGEVRVGGHDIRGLNLNHLRSHIGYVGQSPQLFDMSCADNIRYGCPGATMEDVVRAAKLANIHNFIVEQLQEVPEDGDGADGAPKKPLARGYDTMVGEKGDQLSGGQRQRISIARALIRKPRILLLDEATSALDSESEKLVQQALDNLLLDRQNGGYTTLVIAHRLSTIQNSDKIVLMDGGRVAEVGSHQELMQLGGMYRALVEAGGARDKE